MRLYLKYAASYCLISCFFCRGYKSELKITIWKSHLVCDVQLSRIYDDYDIDFNTGE